MSDYNERPPESPPQSATDPGQVFAGAKVLEESVTLPNGVTVLFRGGDETKLAAVQAKYVDRNGKINAKTSREMRARMIVAYAVKPDGSPLWKPCDVASVMAQPAHYVKPLFAAANRVSGQGDVDVEDLEGN